MQLYDFTPGTIITAHLGAGGWEFSEQRFVVWKNYGGSDFLLQHINRDSYGDDVFAEIVRVAFDGNTGRTPQVAIFSPDDTGERYIPNDEGANSLELMAASAERWWAGRRGRIPTTDEDILMRALRAADKAAEDERRARMHLAEEAGRVAAAPYSNVSAVAEMLGKTRTTITKWRDAWLERNQ